MRNVERSTPITVLPYIFFSLKTPYFSITVRSGSARRGKSSPCFSANRSWLARVSLLTPRIAAPRRVNFAFASRKAMASFVHPDVASFG
jgi:hypothetical protein